MLAIGTWNILLSKLTTSCSFSAESLALVHAWPGMVSLPTKIMPLLVDSFAGRFSVGPYASSSRSQHFSTLLPRSQHSLVLLPMQDNTEGEFFLQRCGHPLQDLTHLLLDCPASEPLRRAIFGTFFHFWPLVQTLGRGPTVGLLERSSTPPSLGRGRIAPPPPPLVHALS